MFAEAPDVPGAADDRVADFRYFILVCQTGTCGRECLRQFCSDTYEIHTNSAKSGGLEKNSFRNSFYRLGPPKAAQKFAWEAPS
jgi:hypothetical protein